MCLQTLLFSIDHTRVLHVLVPSPFHNYDSVICKYEFVILLPIYFEILDFCTQLFYFK